MTFWPWCFAQECIVRNGVDSFYSSDLLFSILASSCRRSTFIAHESFDLGNNSCDLAVLTGILNTSPMSDEILFIALSRNRSVILTVLLEVDLR